mgnify:CR=1 FL=1
MTAACKGMPDRDALDRAIQRAMAGALLDQGGITREQYRRVMLELAETQTPGGTRDG